MGMKKAIKYIILILIIIGAIVCKVKGFNIDMEYQTRQQIIIDNYTELNTKRIEEIAKEVLAGKKVKVQEVSYFGNSIEITSNEITEEEKQNIINKVNEEFTLDISNDSTKIYDIPNTRIRDILKPYITPATISFAVILLYFIIMYHKIGFKQVLLNSICVPVAAELVYYSLIAIFQIPFGKISNAIALGIYVLSIMYINNMFLEKKEQLPKETTKKGE